MHNQLFNLSHLSSLTVEGEKCLDFLQGQLSCDLRLVTEQKMQKGLICDLKGRILAILDVVKWGQNYQLILPDNLLESTKAILNKPAMLSRVRLNADNKIYIYGLHQKGHFEDFPLPKYPLEVTQTDSIYCYCLAENVYIILAKEPLRTSLSMFEFSNWHQLLLELKRISLYPETKGLFLPHKLDMHLSGYISFDKGCYKGQEIIARMHYKAKLKHSLKFFSITTEEPLKLGQKLLDSKTAMEIGELVDFAPLEGNQYRIAVSILIEHPDVALLEGHINPVELL
jgi:folate-binding protein YgfZ